MMVKDKCWRSDCWRAHQCSGAQSLSVTTIFVFVFFISASLEGQGEFINEENPFLIGAVTGAVCVFDHDFGMCECMIA